jgi:GH18 family chitinase
MQNKENKTTGKDIKTLSRAYFIQNHLGGLFLWTVDQESEICLS